MKERFILTFDLEFWHNSDFLKKYLPENKNFSNDYIIESAEPILDLLNKYGHKATFFVLGKVAEKYPELIKKINDSGHEICSHGYSHAPLSELNHEELKKEIETTNDILEKIISKNPPGFRAPNFSLNKKTSWALKIIEKYFQYDSSVHPFDLWKIKDSIKEAYCSLGGFYFRLLPLRVFILLAKIFSKQKPSVLYFHPYELFESSPRINVGPWYKRRIKYWGTKTAWKKFEKLMEGFRFLSYENFINQPAD